MWRRTTKIYLKNTLMCLGIWVRPHLSSMNTIASSLIFISNNHHLHWCNFISSCSHFWAHLEQSQMLYVHSNLHLKTLQDGQDSCHCINGGLWFRKANSSDGQQGRDVSPGHSTAAHIYHAKHCAWKASLSSSNKLICLSLPSHLLHLSLGWHLCRRGMPIIL